MNNIIQQQFTVPYTYPVWFGHHLFAPGNATLRELLPPPVEGQPAKVLAFVDDGAALAHPTLIADITAWFTAQADAFNLLLPPQIVPGGEASKRGWGQIQKIMYTIGDSRLCRQSYILAIGGGSMLDGTGFAAALVHRGMRLVRIPTTVLAQNDAGIGVKNGMDEHGMKNFVGTFAPPYAVCNDYAFLPTLPDKYWFGGLAEAFKVAIIKDAPFFAQLEALGPALRQRDQTAIEQVVRRCAELHLEHIRTGGDPFEFGSARPLDFGHWAAHKLEIQSGYTLGHGQAVAIGIALDTRYAQEQGLLTQDEAQRILDALQACNLPISSPHLNADTLQGLEDFREHLGGRLTITLPNGIGQRLEVNTIDSALMLRLIQSQP